MALMRLAHAGNTECRDVFVSEISNMCSKGEKKIIEEVQKGRGGGGGGGAAVVKRGANRSEAGVWEGCGKAAVMYKTF